MQLRIERSLVTATIAATVALILWPALLKILGPAGVGLAALGGAGVAIAAWRVLPAGLDGAFRRHPGRGTALLLLALLMLVQTARLGAFMLDRESNWWVTTADPFWSKHVCAVAYFYAADLDRQGESNIYDPSHYPGVHRDAEVHPTVANLAPEDPFLYPPQFLLLPKLALTWSNDFEEIRPVWYALQALLFLGVAVLLARRTGSRALWLLPLLWISVPGALNFQYGQFHASALALGMGAFLAFDQRRFAIGGALLAATLLGKGFAGILLVPLLIGREWRALGWTLGWSGALTAVAWGVLGPEPFAAFFAHHLGSLASGASLTFEEAWPEFRTALLAGNVSPLAAVRKVAELTGFGGAEGGAHALQLAFTVACVGLAVVGARWRTPESRALGWLALLNLATMTSPATWGDYVPLGTLWLVTLLAAGPWRIPTPALAATAAFLVLLPGVVPIAGFPGPTASYVLSVFATVLLIGVNTWTCLAAAFARFPRSIAGDAGEPALTSRVPAQLRG